MAPFLVTPKSFSPSASSSRPATWLSLSPSYLHSSTFSDPDRQGEQRDLRAVGGRLSTSGNILQPPDTDHKMFG